MVSKNLMYEKVMPDLKNLFSVFLWNWLFEKCFSIPRNVPKKKKKLETIICTKFLNQFEN